MSYKLLIDECLSPKLVLVAQAAGHYQSTCVRDRGWLGISDHALIREAVGADFTLVTRNAIDFRGASKGPPGGLYNRESIHPGLICLDSYFELDIERQQRLFHLALEELRHLNDLVNLALEIYENEDGSVSVNLYQIPLEK